MNSDRDSVLIIGYGNPLRGDDCAGPCVARELRRRGFHAIEVQQLTPELAETIAGFEVVVFVDADVTAPPGEVRTVALTAQGAEVPLAGESSPGPLEHSLSPSGLLSLAAALYGKTPRASLLGIGCESFELGDRLSIAARRGVHAAITMCLGAGYNGL